LGIYRDRIQFKHTLICTKYTIAGVPKIQILRNDRLMFCSPVSETYKVGEHVISLEVSFTLKMEAVGSKPHGVSSHKTVIWMGQAQFSSSILELAE
jgi:hypothetical protein